MSVCGRQLKYMLENLDFPEVTYLIQTYFEGNILFYATKILHFYIFYSNKIFFINYLFRPLKVPAKICNCFFSQRSNACGSSGVYSQYQAIKILHLWFCYSWFCFICSPVVTQAILVLKRLNNHL